MIPTSIWHWWAFVGFIVCMLALDLAASRRRTAEMTMREALCWTAFWTALAIAFDGLLWYAFGLEPAARFLTGYLVEWSLSLDNIFVFAVIFAAFHIPRENQHRVLFWGVLGAIVMRLLFVLAGMALIHSFEWIMPLLGALIIFLAIRLAMHGQQHVDPSKNILLKVARRFFPVSEAPSSKFFERGDDGRRRATSLLLVLLAIESVDLVFAVDSVPAIFGVTRDPFLVFSSNILAILGLRSLYFLLAGLMDRFHYLHYGISAVLVFIGGKMIADYAAKHFGWVGAEGELIPYWASLVVVVALLGCSMLVSVAATRSVARSA